MRAYGQFCPVAKAAELFCERWTPLILRELATGATHYSEVQRGVPLMSPTLLSRRLRQLEAEGVIERRPQPSGKGSTYHLTRAGAEFVPVVQALGVWGQRWTRRRLADNEVDLGLLIWALEKGVDAAAFGPTRTVIRLEFRDQPEAKRLWWFVNEGGCCELCLSDPGYLIDLYLATELRDMIYLVRGDLSLARAIDLERLEVIGAAEARRALAAWLNLSPIAAVPSERHDAPSFAA